MTSRDVIDFWSIYNQQAEPAKNMEKEVASRCQSFANMVTNINAGPHANRMVVIFKSVLPLMEHIISTLCSGSMANNFLFHWCA